MGLETYFKVIAFDKTGEKRHSKEDIHARYLKELKHEVWTEKTDEDFEKQISEEGYLPVIELRGEPTEDDKKYNQLSRQVENPFPVWIDTKTGNEGYEIIEQNFLSDFTQLYQHLNLTGSGAFSCVEISKDDAKKMLQVLNYIRLKKYNRDVEEALFEDNEFFDVFERQFFNFSMRFKKKKKNLSNQQLIRVIIEDHRTNVVQDADYENEEDYDDYENNESEKEEYYQIEALSRILTTFIALDGNQSWKSNPTIEYKLVYFLSY